MVLSAGKRLVVVPTVYCADITAVCPLAGNEDGRTGIEEVETDLVLADDSIHQL